MATYHHAAIEVHLPWYPPANLAKLEALSQCIMMGVYEVVCLIQLSPRVPSESVFLWSILVDMFYWNTFLLSVKPCRSAKERKVRIWKNYVAPTANLDQKERQFVAKVSFWSLCRVSVQSWRKSQMKRSLLRRSLKLVDLRSDFRTAGLGLSRSELTIKQCTDGRIRSTLSRQPRMTFH